MSFSYKGSIFDKRGCYVILPSSPFWRIDSTNDNAADEDVEVLEGPEVEITDSCASDGNHKEAKMEASTGGSDHDNDTESEDSDSKTSQQSANGTSLHGKKAKIDPDNKYYEVEAILDGPRKRREHLLKLCYKVRWKGYGPEADTWQPIADLTNVQDMIDEYNQEKSTKKEKKKQPKNSQLSGTTRRVRSLTRTPPLVKDKDRCGDGKKQYDPVYGTVKDKFWKDLELGRHQNHSQLFSADMYSKVKGCRRAALTDAGAKKHRSRRLSESKSWRHLQGDCLRKPRSSSPTSPNQHFRKSRSNSPTSRMRKRSREPLGASGYVCTKRSRRLREARTGYCLQDNQQLNISSVTSETMGIVAMSSPLTPLDVPDNRILYKFSGSSSADVDSSVSEYETEDACPGADHPGRMTVSSETMLTVTTESKRLDPQTRLTDDSVHIADRQMKLYHHIPDTESFRLNRGGNCQFHSSDINFGASGDESFKEMPFHASGATSGGELSGRCAIKRTLCLKRSTLDSQSEASGAVERSHDEDCLWNGACNRSDCKSNRRRNMKNGQGKVSGMMPSDSDDDEQNITGDNVHSEMEDNGDNVCSSEGGGSQATSEDNCVLDVDNEADEYDESMENMHSASGGRGTSSQQADSSNVNIFSAQRGSSPEGGDSSSSLKKSSPKSKRSANYTPSSHKSGSKGSESQSSAQNLRLLFSSAHADSSDSSFDDGPSSGAPLSQQAVSSSFDTLAHRLQADTSAGSTGPRPFGLVSSMGYDSSRGSIDARKSSMEIERPGLFSGNNSALMFSSRACENYSPTTPEERQEQSFLPNQSGSINRSSPGKENFGNSSKLRASGIAVSRSYTSPHPQTGMSVPNSNSGTVAGSQPQPSQPGINADRTEVLTRKRGSDIFQPLEKIPSPNARESDLDQRIVTLTCDDLEDFVEQGEERCKQKDTSFISNADLLQAVNLNKAEVVKRAVTQFRLSEIKLDFEQPDITGVTLLMRAVQRGTVAIAEMLLEHGVNVNAQQTNGTTALMIAAEQNGTCLVALLLKHGANSSLYALQSDQAETALMKAIRKQHREVVSLMLRVGVNIAAPTCSSLSALELSVERRNPHIEGIVRFHCQRLDQAFRNRVLTTLDGTANLLEPLFALQCFPLRESSHFVVKFSSNLHPVAPGEGFILFIAHTKITEKGVKCRFHGVCPISSVTLNGVAQSPLTKEVNFVTSCHPIIHGCNTLVIHKLADYTSKAKLVVQAFRARLIRG